MEKRICKKCGHEKEINLFRKYLNVKKDKFLIRKVCKSCVFEDARIKKGSKKRQNKIVNGKKVCQKCDMEKPLNEFHKMKNSVKPRCKKCTSEIRHIGKKRMIDIMFESWINKVKQKIIREFSKRVVMTEKQRILARRVYAKRASIKNKDYRRNWLSTHREESRLWWHKRNSLIKSSEDGTVTADAIRGMMVEQGNKCKICQKNIEINYHIDHIIPISKKGKHSILNIQLLCPLCNKMKFNKILDNNKLLYVSSL